MKEQSISTKEVFAFLKKHKMWYSVVCRADGDGDHLEAICNCPFCGDTEKKFSINTKTGMWNCFHLNNCGRKGDFFKLALLLGDDEYKKLSSKVVGVKNMKKNFKEPLNEETNIKLSEELYEFFEKRYISRKIIDYCGNAIQEVDKNGKKIVCFVHKKTEEKNSEVSFIHGRFIDDTNPGEKKHIVSLTKNPVLTLWLKEKVEKQNSKRDKADKLSSKLFITEGHFDTLALLSYGIKNSVSIPQGVNSLDWVDNDWEFINSFHDVYLVFDNDPIGREKSREIADKLVTKVHLVTLPLKDANDCLIKYRKTKDANSEESKSVSKQAIWEAISTAKVVRVEEITVPDDHRKDLLELIFSSDKTIGISTGFKNVDTLINGLRDGELTILSGRSGSGKSTFLSQVMLNLMKGEKPVKFCLSSFEMKNSEILYGMAQQQYKKEIYTDETKEAATTKVDLLLDMLRDHLSFITIKDEIEISYLLKLIELTYRRKNTKYFVIDSLMCIENNDASENRGQTSIIRRLKSISRRFGLHIILVAHPRKTDGVSILRKEDILGSSNTINLADNLLILHEISKEYKQHAIRENAMRKKNGMSEIKIPNCSCFLYCDKFRFKGNKDARAYFNFNETSKSFVECDVNGKEYKEN